MSKPAPTVIGVHGFNAFTTKADDVNGFDIDWQRLLHLPPFEMYLFEMIGNHDLQARGEYLLARLQKDGEQAVYESYAQWHKDKGYWANETPLGQLIG